MLAITLLLLIRPAWAAESLSREEVAFLNSEGICPVRPMTFAVRADGALTPVAGGLDPVAAQWRGKISIAGGAGPPGTGADSIQAVVLTCRARLRSRNSARAADADITLSGAPPADPLGGSWTWSLDPQAKFLTLTPQAESPSGYRFGLGFNRIEFTGLVSKEEIVRRVSELYRTPRGHETRAVARRRAPASASGGHKAASRSKMPPPFPEMSRLPTEPGARFDYYRKHAAVFRKFHDKDRLDDSQLRYMLGQAGLMPDRSGAPWTPSPFPVSSFRGGFRWPLDAGIVSSEFGRRWGRPHEGIDIAAALHEPVFAAAEGRVIYAGDGLRGYGNVILVRHDRATVTLYAHNLSLLVRDGDWVRNGQMIALLGSTGHSTGPHVHFEIRQAGEPVNPRNRLPPSRF